MRDQRHGAVAVVLSPFRKSRCSGSRPRGGQAGDVRCRRAGRSSTGCHRSSRAAPACARRAAPGRHSATTSAPPASSANRRRSRCLRHLDPADLGRTLPGIGHVRPVSDSRRRQIRGRLKLIAVLDPVPVGIHQARVVPIDSSSSFGSRSPSWSEVLLQAASGFWPGLPALRPSTTGDRRRGVKALNLPARTRSLIRVGRCLPSRLPGGAPRSGILTTSLLLLARRGLTRRCGRRPPEDDGIRALLRLEPLAANGQRVADLDAHRRDAGDLRLRCGGALGGGRRSRHRAGGHGGGDDGERCCSRMGIPTPIDRRRGSNPWGRPAPAPRHGGGHLGNGDRVNERRQLEASRGRRALCGLGRGIAARGGRLHVDAPDLVDAQPVQSPSSVENTCSSARPDEHVDAVRRAWHAAPSPAVSSASRPGRRRCRHRRPCP